LELKWAFNMVFFFCLQVFIQFYLNQYILGLPNHMVEVVLQ